MTSSNIDSFASLLLEEAKRFLELAKESDTGEEGKAAYLHSALMLGFCSLEAHINAVCDEMSYTANLSPHDLSVLKEKEVRLDNGRYKLTKVLKIFRLEDRILFLHARFSSAQLSRGESWWSDFQEAILLRNSLTHPKQITELTVGNIDRALLAIVSAIDATYQALYRKPFPARARGLQSRLTF